MSLVPLVLLRHGESEWNEKNLFTGWVDVGLTEKGEAEAARGGELLRERGLLPDVVHTSLLRRAIRPPRSRWTPPTGTGSRCAGRWRLNERHYGALQGKDKKATLEEFGEEQFMLWRRSYDTPPPPLADDDEFARSATRATPTCPTRCCRAPSAWPTSSTGCCRTGTTRSCRTCAPARPCWSPRTATRCARWSSTSTGSSDDDIVGLNIPTGIPLLYDLDDGPAAAPARRGVPRPGRGGRRDRGGQEPGPLTAARRSGSLAPASRWSAAVTVSPVTR